MVFNDDAPFLRMDYLTGIFMKLYLPHARMFGSQKSKIASKCLSAIRYFRDVGLFLFYEDVPLLNQFVFYKPMFLLDLLKAIFHHDLPEVLNYDEIPLLRKQFKKRELITMMKQYSQDGLLSGKLLDFLCHQYGMQDQDRSVLVQLLQAFSLCYKVSNQLDVYYFPWFVQNNIHPDEAKEESMHRFGRKIMSVHLECCFAGDIPGNLFEIASVQVQKLASTKGYKGERYAWNNGLLIKVGTLKWIIKRSNERAIISFSVSGRSMDCRAIWLVMSDFHSDFGNSLEPYEGIIDDIYILCNHCLLLRNLNPCKLSPEEVLRVGCSDVPYLTCGTDAIPRALVSAFSDNHSDVQQDILNLEYLLGIIPEARVPGKLFYLDCKIIASDEIEISWGWPQDPIEGEHEGQDSFTVEIDKSVTHAVIEYKEGEELKRVKAETSPYVLAGQRGLFRVAAVNDHGTGQYMDVSPSKVLKGSRVMSDEDRNKMEMNLASFAGMTSSLEIILKLFSRKVISEQKRQALLRRYTYDGANIANALLMEDVYKMTYDELFLFQKTLTETGQTVLAKTVPVEIEVLSGTE